MADVRKVLHVVEEAYEVYGWPQESRLVISCEHASNRLPLPAAPDQDDLPWLETHWAYDIGARDIVLDLVDRTGSTAALSRFSRLYCDANRATDDPDLIRPRVEEHTLAFNEFVFSEERARRVEAFHRPYHEALDKVIRERRPEEGDMLLLSVHTFVPALYGLRRNLDVGVLYDPYEAVAMRLAGSLSDHGLKTLLNEPYSGRRGLIYAAARHGHQHGLIYLELEINQALLSSTRRTRKLSRTIASCLESLKLRRRERAGGEARARSG